MSYSSAIGTFSIGNSPIEGVPLAPSALGAAALERLYDQVQTTLPSITLPIIDMMLWNAVEEFCIRGLYLRANVYWQMAQGVTSVDFNPFSATMVVVWVIDFSGLNQWEINPPAQVVDLLQPNTGRNGSAVLVLKPVSLEVVKEGFTPELFTTWYETMVDGTLFRLYGIPARPWSSPQLAQYHGTRYRQGIMRARDIAERLHSQQQSPRRTYPYYARGRRKN
jgi:hypothetical protein